jgi:glucose/arabinose dehydrogenase
LFIIDPNNPDAAHTTVYSDKFSSIPVTWQGGKIVIGNDGNVYVSIGAKLYAVDANSATKDAVVLVGAGVKHETNLYKYDK